MEKIKTIEQWKEKNKESLHLGFIATYAKDIDRQDPDLANKVAHLYQESWGVWVTDQYNDYLILNNL